MSGSLILGGGVVALAAFLGGVSGFGAALVCTPILLLIGFPLDFVVTVNLVLLLFTRLSTSYRFRKHVHFRTASMLIISSIPGLYLGVRVLDRVDASTIKFLAGLFIVIVAVMMSWPRATRHSPTIPGAPLLAGLAGGFLGSTTSLSGIPPAMLLTRDEVEPLSFLATLAAYFVVSSGIALTLLANQGALVASALFPVSTLWLPGAIIGNSLGSTFGSRLPEAAFKRATLAIVFVAGCVTVFTA